MAGPRKVSAQEIANALLEWRGNVQAAAEALGLRRNSLYERIQKLELNLAGFRAAGRAVVPVTSVTGVSGVPGRQRQQDMVDGGEHARKDEPAPFTEQSAERRFGTVESAKVLEPDSARTPVHAIQSRARAPRLRPGQQDRLREAKLDLGAKYRVETNENLILQQFFDENFEDWLDRKLAPQETAEARKRGAGRP